MRAFRGGVAAGQQQWAWPSGPVRAEDDWSDLDILPGEDGAPATVVVTSVQRRALFGLDGRTGVPRWRNRAEAGDGAGRGVVLDRPGRLPLVVYSRSGRDTVCRVSLPVAADGRYRPASEPEDERPRYEESKDDPRLLRPLPWKELGDFHGWGWLWLGPIGLALALLVVPALLLHWTLCGRSWRRALLLAGWLAVLAVGFPFARTADLLHMGDAPAWAHLIVSVVLALAGLALLAPPILAARWAIRRRWRGVVLVLALLLATSVAAGAFMLWIDHHQGIDPEERYSWRGWYLAALPGDLVAGVLLLQGWLMLLVIRGLAAGIRRIRGSRR